VLESKTRAPAAMTTTTLALYKGIKQMELGTCQKHSLSK